MAAAFHQVEIIQHGQLALDGSDGLQQLLLIIVAQHQHMGEFDAGILTDTLTGRNTLQNGLFGGADSGHRTHIVVILIQVHSADQAGTDRAVEQGTLNIDISAGIGGKHIVCQVSIHGLIDLLDACSLIGTTQMCFGQDHMEGGSLVTDGVGNTLPIGSIGSELVAGNHSPAMHIRGLGEQNIGGTKNFHLGTSFRLFLTSSLY